MEKRGENGVKTLENPKALIEYSDYMLDCFKNIEEYHPDIDCIVSLVSDDLIAYKICHKKRNQIVTESFIRGKKLNIFPDFIRRAHFQVPKDVRRNCAHFFIMKNRI